MTERKGYDYAIVGAGSAGCVLANRLSADPQVRVLLLEAGPKDRSIYIHMPSAFAYPLADDKFNWFYESEPEPYMDNRRMYCPRGRVLGGSSSINGMVYIRGHARDYDRWAQTGLTCWSYADVLPYFRKAETRAKGGDDYRGDSGPLHVSTARMDNPLFDTFVKAAVEAGYPYTNDMNGYQQEGFGPMDMTVHKGRRWSAAKAYLSPIMGRPNLTVETGAFTTRILFEKRRAVGVEYAARGQLRQARAEREVIASTGAINTPQLLMLSGIGNADELRKLDIPLVADRPGVGENLQDHLEIYVQYECTQPVSLYPALKPWNKFRIGLDWLLFRKGIGASNQFEAGGFIRSRPGIEHPNLQYHFLPMAISYDARQRPDRHGFQAHVGPMRPTSVGCVKLASNDPRAHPRIRFNYNMTEGDRQEMREAVRLTREIFAQKAFDTFRGPEMAPGSHVRSDAEIDAFVRAKAESAYHPSCSCKMGVETDPMAVVDAEGRVYDVEGLRVVDASIMPSIVSGNLNAPTIMIAEKLADAILDKQPLPPAEVAVYIAPDWQHAQR